MLDLGHMCSIEAALAPIKESGPWTKLPSGIWTSMVEEWSEGMVIPPESKKQIPLKKFEAVMEGKDIAAWRFVDGKNILIIWNS